MIRLLICAIVPLLLLASPADAEGIEPGACFKAELPRAGGPLRSITARIGKRNVIVQYTEWDAPNARFVSDAYCNSTGPRLYHCGVDCDGGQVHLVLTPDGKLSLFADGLRTGIVGLPSRLIPPEEGGGSLSGLYILSQSGSTQCEPVGDDHAVPLGPGDDTPAVKSAEAILNGLGFFLQRPDNVFTGGTADAVKRFQAAYGLKATGEIDAVTAHKLVTALAAGGGGC